MPKILGNMLLDGLQSRVYDRLYPNGGTDYKNGSMVRFADDMVFTARTPKTVQHIVDLFNQSTLCSGKVHDKFFKPVLRFGNVRMAGAYIAITQCGQIRKSMLLRGSSGKAGI